MQNIQRPFGKFDIASPRVFKLLLSPEKFSEYTFWYVCADWNVFENGNLRTNTSAMWRCYQLWPPSAHACN